MNPADQLCVAARNGNRAVVERLLAADPALVHSSDEDPITGVNQVTPLDAVASAGRTAVVAILLRLGADPNRVPAGPYHSPPLIGAAMCGRADLLKLLMDAGADPNLAASNGLTPLQAAIMGDHPVRRRAATRQLLEAGADPRAGCRGGPIWHAASAGDVDVLDTLAAAGANATPAALVRPLFAAVRYNRPAAVAWLLEHGADPDARSPGGWDWEDDTGLTAGEYAGKLGCKKVGDVFRRHRCGPAAKPRKRGTGSPDKQSL